MMEAARTSKTLVNFNQTTRRYNPEDSHLRTHRRENLKSYLICTVFIFGIDVTTIIDVIPLREIRWEVNWLRIECSVWVLR
jgi:hypothetical protein